MFKFGFKEIMEVVNYCVPEILFFGALSTCIKNGGVEMFLFLVFGTYIILISLALIKSCVYAMLKKLKKN